MEIYKYDYVTLRRKQTSPRTASVTMWKRSSSRTRASNSRARVTWCRMYSCRPKTPYDRRTIHSFKERNRRARGICQCCNSKDNRHCDEQSSVENHVSDRETIHMSSRYKKHIISQKMKCIIINIHTNMKTNIETVLIVEKLRGRKTDLKLKNISKYTRCRVQPF
jgi:hypothetical protein